MKYEDFNDLNHKYKASKYFDHVDAQYVKMIVSDNKVEKEVGEAYKISQCKEHARKDKLLEYTKNVDH